MQDSARPLTQPARTVIGIVNLQGSTRQAGCDARNGAVAEP